MILSSSTILVIGAGSGIGRAVAQAASRAGARVILLGRTLAHLEATASTLSGPYLAYPLDATREEDVAAFFETIGPFDHLVSTASQGSGGPLTGLSAATISNAFGAKLWAPIFLLKYGASHISRNGSFTFFSGFRAARPARGTAITSLVNGGLEAFAKAMALELAPVRVNVISPGVVDTGSFWDRLGEEAKGKVFADFAAKAPAGRVGSPEDQAAAVLFAMTNPFLTGALLPVDGGGQLT